MSSSSGCGGSGQLACETPLALCLVLRAGCHTDMSDLLNQVGARYASTQISFLSFRQAGGWRLEAPAHLALLTGWLAGFRGSPCISLPQSFSGPLQRVTLGLWSWPLAGWLSRAHVVTCSEAHPSAFLSLAPSLPPLLGLRGILSQTTCP